MRLKLGIIFSVVVLGILSFSCQKKVSEDNKMVRIGRAVITQSSVDAFSTMRNMYPAVMNKYFPAKRSTPTFLVETEILYRKARSGAEKVKKTLDWQWLERFYPAQMYMSEIISKNLGYTEKDIDTYYKANMDSFKVTIRVRVNVDTAGLDSVAKASALDSTKDSTYYRTVDEVGGKIVEKLFLADNEPDSAYYASLRKSEYDTMLIDTAVAKRNWLKNLRRNMVPFYLAKDYKLLYGTNLSDSALSSWYGDGKLITPKDINTVMNWLPESRRAGYNNEAGKKYLADWLLKWKVFSEMARRTGYSSTKKVSDVLSWALKLEVADNYLNSELIPNAVKNVSVDTAMAIYSFWDKNMNASLEPDSADIQKIVSKYAEGRIASELDRSIVELRRRIGVEFLQSDWKDNKDQNPQELSAKADSLLGKGDSKGAESIYKDIVDNFSYSKNYFSALNELARIQTEMGRYSSAIENYRNRLVYDKDSKHRCNTFFMIGFIYDEYMNKPGLAELQYKWILKNTPECELAPDAEFMILHLDEPMTSVEELRAEAKRQGRNVDEEKTK